MAQRGEYTAIHTALVDDEGFLALSANARLCFYTLKMILGPSGIEVVRMFVPQMAQLTGLTEMPLRVALEELRAGKWLLQQGDVVWLRNGLRFNPNLNLNNDNHKLGVERHLRGLPSSAIVNAFAAHYGYPEIAIGKGLVWPTYPYTDQVHGTRNTVEVHGNGSVSKETGDESPDEVSQKDVMGILRDKGFTCDKHDGSIAKALLEKGVTRRDAWEQMAGGLRLLCDRGEFRHMQRPILPGGELSLKLVYAAHKADGQLPLWRKADLAYDEAQKKRGGRSEPTPINVLGMAG